MSNLIFVRHHCIDNASRLPVIGRPSSNFEQHYVFPSKCESYNKMSVFAAAVLEVVVKAYEQSADPAVFWGSIPLKKKKKNETALLKEEEKKKIWN